MAKQKRFSGMDEFHPRYKTDNAGDVIGTMRTWNRKLFYINTFNGIEITIREGK